MEKADEILKKAEEELLPEHKGEIIAIDEDSGDYELGESVLEACDKLSKRHPGKIFKARRLGFDYVYFIGGLHGRQVLPWVANN